jgi:allantoicase
MGRSPLKSARIEEGSRVEGNYRGKGKWYKGTVTRDRGDHTFDVNYDDGESETRVDELLLRLMGGSSSAAVELIEGSAVEAFYKGKKWYPGKISRVRLNGTFDINYDDGEKEIGVTRENVRSIASERRGLSPRADRERDAMANTSNRIEEGSKIEGNYRGKGKWYTGKVTRDRRDGTFDVAYDDGESETRVDELMLRLIGGGGGMGRSPLKSARIEEGSRVEGNYRGKGKWYKGTVTRDRGDHTFDVNYDDGESETRVDELLLRLMGGSSSAAVELIEGSAVEAFYKGKKWYPGKISRVRLNGTFDINYDDGEKEIGVTRENVRSIASERRGLSPRADRERDAMANTSNRIEEGSKIEGNYRGKGKWYTGKVTRDRRDGTFDVAYDDGESETRVDELMLRLIGGGGGRGGGMGRSPLKSARIEEGSRVEGNYRGKGKWYKGTVTRDRGDHTFDVNYDDGESETRVDELLLRLMGGSSSMGNTSNRIEEGSKIEGNYRGKGKWYTGKVTRDRRDGTFDVAYDDGESETRVDELMLRLIDEDDRYAERGRKKDSFSSRSRVSSRSPDRSRDRARGGSERNVRKDDSRERRTRSRSDEDRKKERSCLLSSSIKKDIQDITRKYQQKSTDGTCRKVFEAIDESPSTGMVTKKEFKKVNL